MKPNQGMAAFQDSLANIARKPLPRSAGIVIGNNVLEPLVLATHNVKYELYTHDTGLKLAENEHCLTLAHGLQLTTRLWLIKACGVVGLGFTWGIVVRP